MRRQRNNFSKQYRNPSTAINGLKRRSMQQGFSEDEKQMLFQIMRQALLRTRQDIDTWRQAIREAEHPENPRRGRLLTMYADLVLDDHTSSQLQIRRSAVTQTAFLLTDDSGEPNAEAARLLRRPWFKDFLNHALDSRFFGHSLMEFHFRPNKTPYPLPVLAEVSRVELVNRRHVVPEFGLVLRQEYDSEGIVWDSVPGVIAVGGERELGLLLKCAPAWIYKKNAVACWSEFAEKFGNPIVVAKTRNRNDDTLNKLEDTIRGLGSMAYGLFDETNTLELLESSKSDAFKVYEELAARSDKAISKVITGVTMLSEDGSSYSQSKVHERVADYIFEEDRDMTEWLINDELLPLLIRKGYPLEGLTFQWDTSVEVPLQEQWQLIEGILKHYKVPAEYIEEKFNVPVEDRSSSLDGQGGAGSPDGQEGDGEEDENEPGTDDPERNDEEPGTDDEEEASATGLLRALFRNTWVQKLLGGPKKKSPATGTELRRSGRGLYTPPQIGCCTKLDPQALSVGDITELSAVWLGVLEILHSNPKQDFYFDEGLFSQTAEILWQGFTGSWNRPDLRTQGWNQPDHAALAFYRQNLFAFSAAKTMAQLQEAAAQLTDETGRTRSFSKFKQAVEEAGIFDKYNKNWLRAEYQHAVSSGQMASKWLGIAERGAEAEEFDSVLFLRYDTAGDDRVRSSHQALDGLTLPWNDPAWNTYYPPNGWGCRCTVVEEYDAENPSDPDSLGSIPSEAKPAKYFRRNVGNSTRVFDNEVDLTGLTGVEHYGLRDHGSIYSNTNTPKLPKPELLESREEFDLWWESQSNSAEGPEGGFMMQDVLGAKLVCKEELKRHAYGSAKYRKQERWRHYPELSNLLNDPDEVWANKVSHKGKDQLQLVYVRYYQNVPYVVRAVAEEGLELEAIAIHTLEPQKKKQTDKQRDKTIETNLNRYRKGLLYYKKARP